MIEVKVIDKAACRIASRACLVLPEDVKKAYREAIDKETENIAKYFLIKYLEHLRLAEKMNWPLCADPGTPRWYVKIGNEAEIEGGLISLEKVLKMAIENVTKNLGIRPNVCHPITRWNSGNNIGPRIPPIDYTFEPNIEWIELTSSWKGGVSGTDYRLCLPADDIKGIKKAILDCVVPTLKEGHQCPPQIVGVGLGGTKDYSLKLAKEAAILRPISNRHPDPDISKLELELLKLLNGLGFGVAGLPGKTSIFDVHIEIAYTHTMGLPIGITNHCGCVRRATARICSDNIIEMRPYPEWFTNYLRGIVS